MVEGISRPEIKRRTRVKPPVQRHIQQRAKERGFKPAVKPRIYLYLVEDGARSGRPKEISEAVEQRLINSVKLDRAGREKSSEYLAYEQNISPVSALRVLYKYGLSSVKST